VFDKDFDANAANAAIERQYEQARDEMWNAAKKQMDAREVERQRKRQEASQTHQGTLQVIEGWQKQAHQSLDDEYSRRMQENQREFEAARKEWQDAVNAARKKGKEARDKGPDAAPGMPDIDKVLAEAQAKMKGLSGLLSGLEKRTVEARGTFNAAEARGLGAGGLQDRIAAATEQTARNTGKLVNQEGGKFGA
jgi:hypothetical protein